MNELQNRPIESLFEELENITLPTTKVNELVTDLKNIVMDQLTWKSVDDKPENCKIVQARHKNSMPFYGSYDSRTDEWYDRDGLVRNPDFWMPIPKLD